MSEKETFDFEDDDAPARPRDYKELSAVEDLRRFFDGHAEDVLSSRQIEVAFEDRYFHWITNRAIRGLQAEGFLKAEFRPLAFGGQVKLLWKSDYRYFRRKAGSIVKLIEEYSEPNIGGAIGLHCELLVLEGFAKHQFIMHGREVREFAGKEWTESDHDLDFIFERDGRAYGIEVKNTLGYMEYDELQLKIRMCEELGLIPVFVVRMIPKSWIEEVRQAGGFSLILKYQLYPPAHKDLANRVKNELGLPIGTPRALESGTVGRFLTWHRKQLPNG